MNQFNEKEKRDPNVPSVEWIERQLAFSETETNRKRCFQEILAPLLEQVSLYS
jgi:hypothetical protein